MGRMNAWTAETDWVTGRQRQRAAAPAGRVWRPPPAHGALPKRPLTFVEALDAGFRLLRFAPASSLGAALIVVSLWTLALTALGLILAARFLPVLDDIMGDSAASTGLLVLVQLGSAAMSLLSLGMVHFLAGLTVIGADEAFGGIRLGLGATWARLRGRRGRLVVSALMLTGLNLALLILLAVPTLLLVGADSIGPAVLSGLLALLVWGLAVAWLNLRCAFVGSLIGAQDLRLGAALRRSWVLTRHGFWRLLGQLGLGWFLSNQLVQLIITPFVVVLTAGFGIIIGTLDESEPITVGLSLVLGAVSVGLGIVSTAVLFAYFACLVSVCLIDRRMRSEGYDLVLIRRAERTGEAEAP